MRCKASVIKQRAMTAVGIHNGMSPLLKVGILICDGLRVGEDIELATVMLVGCDNGRTRQSRTRGHPDKEVAAFGITGECHPNQKPCNERNRNELIGRFYFSSPCNCGKRKGNASKSDAKEVLPNASPHNRSRGCRKKEKTVKSVRSVDKSMPCFFQR